MFVIFWCLSRRITSQITLRLLKLWKTFLASCSKTPVHRRAHPMALKWKRGNWVICISCLVPHTALIDLPRYMSDQISGESALTSAFGISRLSALFVQNMTRHSGFLASIDVNDSENSAEKFGAFIAICHIRIMI